MSMNSFLGGTWKHQRWKWRSTYLYTTLKSLGTDCFGKHDITSTNMAITSHSRNGQLDIARKLFDEMPHRTVASWNTMISAYSKRGRFKHALNILSSMHFNNVKLNETTLCSGLSSCARLPSFHTGKQLHCIVLRSGLEDFQHVGSALLYFYANCYEIEEAKLVFNLLHEKNELLWSLMLVCYVQCNLLDNALDIFNRMPFHDTVSWTALISGFSKREDGFKKAFELFCLMRRKGEANPNEFTLDSVIRVCGRLGALIEGKIIHCLVIRYGFEFDHLISGALIGFYCACEEINDGKRVYHGLSNPNISDSNSLIEGLVGMGMIEEAEFLFNGLVKKDSKTYNLMIKAYSLINRFEDSIKLFLKTPQNDLSSLNTMIFAYSRNGNLDKALEIFEQSKEERNTVTWNSMISGYIHNNQQENALNLYKTMHKLNIEKSRSTFSSLFHACSWLGSLQTGKSLHAHLCKTPFASNVYVGTSLVDMYSKCGSVMDAQSSFYTIQNPNVATWSALVNSYAHHGLSHDAIRALHNMVNHGVNPNGATFTGVLAACAHAGWVDEGMKYFRLMNESYGLSPTIEHFTCIVDLLGRSGRMQEAEEIIKKMPFEVDGVVLGALLKACWILLDVEVGERVAKKMVCMNPKDVSGYVMMSNMYCGIGRWKEKVEVRGVLEGLEVKKDRGCSWIEVDNKVCVFSVEDRSHPCFDIIFSNLENLTMNSTVTIPPDAPQFQASSPYGPC